MKFNSILSIASIALVQSVSAINLLEALQADADLSSLVTIAAETGILATLTPFLIGNSSNITIFAPVNAAFAPLLVNQSLANQTERLSAILTYHVLPTLFVPTVAGHFVVETLLKSSNGTNANLNKLGNGQGQALLAEVGNSTAGFSVLLNRHVNVIRSVVTDNGVVHIVDAIIPLPKSVSETAIAANFTSLVSSLAASNLVATVDAAVGVTIFAPTDAAFALLASVPTGEALANALKYHVIPGIFYSTSLLAGGFRNISVPTLLGGPITVDVSSLGISVKGSANNQPIKVILADVLTSNGVIHVIDAVLLPSASDVKTVTPNVNSSAFVTKTTVLAFIALALVSIL